MAEPSQFPFSLLSYKNVVQRYCQMSLFENVMNKGNSFHEGIKEKFEFQLRSDKLLKFILFD